MQTGEISEMILTCLNELLTELDARPPESEPLDRQTQLIGALAVLGSLGLVRLIVDVEQRVADAYGIRLTLADDRAMSQRSPFRTVATFADYVEVLVNEGNTRAQT